MPDDDRRKAGLLRVRAAMHHVEAAQRELAYAQADLASVIGFIPEGRAADSVYKRVRDLWYRLERYTAVQMLARGPAPRTDRGLLDRDALPIDLDDPHDRGCGQRGAPLDH